MSDQTIFFPGALPGLNQILKEARMQGRSGFGGYAAVKEEVDQSLWVQIKNARLYPVAIAFIEFEWIEPDRRRDKDNIASAKKFILDALVKAKVLEGDGWRHVAGFMDIFSVDAKAPGVRVTIKQVE